MNASTNQRTVDVLGIIGRRGFFLTELEVLWFAEWMTPMIGKRIRLRYDRDDMRTATCFDIESGELIGAARLYTSNELPRFSGVRGIWTAKHGARLQFRFGGNRINVVRESAA